MASERLGKMRRRQSLLAWTMRRSPVILVTTVLGWSGMEVRTGGTHGKEGSEGPGDVVDSFKELHPL